MEQKKGSPGPAGPLLDLEQQQIDVPFEELRRGVIDGEEAGWRAFVARYSRMVYSAALHLGRFGEDREDLAHEVYAAVFERLSRDDFKLLRSFRGECRFETYLYTVARNEIQKRRSGARREESRALEFDQSRPTARHVEQQLGFLDSLALDDERVRRLVRESLARLDAEDRLVLQLRFGEGLSYRRMAQMFGWKDTNTAAYRLRKVLSKLNLLARCRETMAWGAAEEEIVAVQLRGWLSTDRKTGCTSGGEVHEV